MHRVSNKRKQIHRQFAKKGGAIGQDWSKQSSRISSNSLILLRNFCTCGAKGGV